MIDRKSQGSACAGLDSNSAAEQRRDAREGVGPSGAAPRRSAGQVLAWVGFGPPEAPWGRTQAPLSSNVPTFGHRSPYPDLFAMDIHRSMENQVLS